MPDTARIVISLFVVLVLECRSPLLAPNASVARKYCSYRFHWYWSGSPDTSHQSNMKGDVCIRKELFAMSRCQAARTCYQNCQRSLGFVCVPVDFKHCASNGFAFINLLSPHQINFEDVLCSMTGRACQDVRVVYAIERASTGLNDNAVRYVDAVPQRYNLSMCAFKVLSSCPRDVSYRRQAAENDILMRKRESPLHWGSPSTGFLPLAGQLERRFLRAHHLHTDADPASHRVRLWRGGSASKVLLPRLFFR